MPRRRLAVTGMTCEGCCNRVERSLAAVAGVESAVVDLQSGLATVITTAGVPIASLVAAVEGTGKGCRLEGEVRRFTRQHPAKGSPEEPLLNVAVASGADCCR